jgi:hypothetical protein
VAFPTVAQRGQARTPTAVNTVNHAITIPAHVAGDKLVVVFSCDGSTAHSVNTGASSTGWDLSNTDANGTIVRGTIAHKTAASSSETLTITSGGAEQSSHQVLVIRPSSGKALAIAMAPANGSSTNSNPPALTPAGGVQDYLWIVTRSGDSTVVATVAPTGFGNLQTLAGIGTAAASTNTAERQLNASTLDPATFTSASEQWVCFTIAVWEVDLPPAVTTQPFAQTAVAAAVAAFTGAAAGGPTQPKHG